ncbi:MAG: hypothetical protein QOF89_175 [Acidobacteriota bacterium]|jgi:hypothetical protein|nr:hypothetical protein [Acidobacteriota bacterium]
MKRDLDLIRKIILTVEDLPTGNVPEEIEIDGYTEEQIGYHSYLIVDSGFAEGVDMGAFGDTSPNWQLIHLTSAGHDFAEASRNETSWNKAKSIVKEKAGGATLDILKEVLIGVIRGTLGLP